MISYQRAVAGEAFWEIKTCRAAVHDVVIAQTLADRFDYDSLLKPGVVSKRNALHLQQFLGLHFE